MASEQNHAEKDPDFCKSVLAEHITNGWTKSATIGPLGEYKSSLNRVRNS